VRNVLEQQLSLPGLAPSPELDFLFFALLPSAEDALQIVSLRERLLVERGLTGQSIIAERFHLSLHTVGAWHGLSRAAVTAAKEVGASFSKPRFEIVFDRAMSFAGNRAFVLRAKSEAPFTSFHHALGIEMKKAGIGRSVTSRFTPHMTLLYGDRMVTERSIEPIHWTVREFVLVQSLRGRGRSRHTFLWRAGRCATETRVQPPRFSNS
jgi:RNA 2',3'-cyclic 3'-phosphodiesterase